VLRFDAPSPVRRNRCCSIDPCVKPKRNSLHSKRNKSMECARWVPVWWNVRAMLSRPQRRSTGQRHTRPNRDAPHGLRSCGVLGDEDANVMMVMDWHIHKPELHRGLISLLTENVLPDALGAPPHTLQITLCWQFVTPASHTNQGLSCVCRAGQVCPKTRSGIAVVGDVGCTEAEMDSRCQHECDLEGGAAYIASPCTLHPCDLRLPSVRGKTSSEPRCCVATPALRPSPLRCCNARGGLQGAQYKLAPV